MTGLTPNADCPKRGRGNGLYKAPNNPYPNPNPIPNPNHNLTCTRRPTTSYPNPSPGPSPSPNPNLHKAPNNVSILLHHIKNPSWLPYVWRVAAEGLEYKPDECSRANANSPRRAPDADAAKHTCVANPNPNPNPNPDPDPDPDQP